MVIDWDGPLGDVEHDLHRDTGGGYIWDDYDPADWFGPDRVFDPNEKGDDDVWK